MKPRDKYPNLRDKRPHPHKGLTYEGLDKAGQPVELRYLKKIIIELPNPIVDAIKLKAKEAGTSMSDMVRHIVLTSEQLEEYRVGCVEDTPILDMHYLKRDELRRMVPVPTARHAPRCAGGQVREPVGKRQLIR
jgi:hypothetical protein